MLQRIDRTQLRFLCEIGCTEPRALLQFRLALLESCRYIVFFFCMLHCIVCDWRRREAALFPVIGAVVEQARRQRLTY